MTHLLVVETSVRGDQSVSRALTQRFIDRWTAANPEGTVTTRDLADTALPYVTQDWLQAYFTPEEHHDDAMRDQLRLSDELVDELLRADHVVIATPVYNYNVPASLKSWIDHIVRKGKTLGFDGTGMITGTTATVLIASGGVYTEDSPLRDRDIASQYLRMVLGVIGISDVRVVAGGDAKSVDMGQRTIGDFVESFDHEIATAVGA